MPDSIATLLEVNLRDRSVQPREKSARWLRRALQCAVELEMSTIPPYLCALWSIKDLDPENYVVQSLRSIAAEEMKHLGQACNLMTAFGWVPTIKRPPTVPRYPGPMPGGVHPGLRLALCPLSKDLIGTVFMQIEFPSPEALTFHGERLYPTIGAFYGAIADVIAEKKIPITGRSQLEAGGGMHLIKVTNHDEALEAVEIIRKEGEGAHGSPWIGEDVLAHYYRFAELFWGREIVPCGERGWGFCGNEIRLPEAYPMAPVPKGGYPKVPEAQAFNRKYTEVLDKLQAAWAAGDQRTLEAAIGEMNDHGPESMPALARKLMAKPRPDGVGNLGPDFHYLRGCRWY